MDRPHILLNEEGEELSLVDERRGAVVGLSKRMPGRTGPNQDSLGAIPTENGVVLAVADGVGGSPEGDRASRVAIEELVRALEGSEGGVRERILDAFEAANKQILEWGSGAATTLSVVEIEITEEGAVCRPYHAGDSSILVCGGRGRVKVSIVPHSPVGYAVEAGLLGPEEALHHSDLNVVSNLVGMSDMRIDLGPRLLLSPRDTITVGTDGLFDNLQAEEIVSIVRKGPIDQARTRLASLAEQRMAQGEGDLPSKPDDIAFLIYRPPRHSQDSSLR